jgi:hypothetical protein
LVKEAAERWEIPARLTRRVRGVRIYAPALRYVDLRAPGYYFLATDTAALMQWLTHEAQRAGATVCYNQRAAWQARSIFIAGPRRSRRSRKTATPDRRTVDLTLAASTRRGRRRHQ